MFTPEEARQHHFTRSDSSVTCVTSRYIPNIAHLVRLLESDVVVLLDLAQMPDRNKNAFVNRNRIRGVQGDRWLTIPVGRRRGLRLKDVSIDPSCGDWAKAHRSILYDSYRLYRGFDGGFLEAYDQSVFEMQSLLDVNLLFLRHIFSFLRIDFPDLIKESEMGIQHDSMHRLTCARALNARTYISGSVEYEQILKSEQDQLFESSNISLVPGIQVAKRGFVEYSVVHWILAMGADWTRSQILRIVESGSS